MYVKLLKQYLAENKNSVSAHLKDNNKKNDNYDRSIGMKVWNSLQQCWQLNSVLPVSTGTHSSPPTLSSLSKPNFWETQPVPTQMHLWPPLQKSEAWLLSGLGKALSQSSAAPQDRVLRTLETFRVVLGLHQPPICLPIHPDPTFCFL